MPDLFTSIIFIGLAALGVTLLVKSVRFVPNEEKWIIEYLGKYSRTIEAGINFTIPFVETVRKRWDIREQVIDVSKQSVITKDNVGIGVDGFLYFKIINPEDAMYGVQNLRNAITRLAQTTMRSTVGAKELDDILSSREAINAAVSEAIQDAGGNWGAEVPRYEIKDIDVPDNITKSMEKQMTAEREKRADILNAEGARQSAILKAEGEKQARILAAEADKEESVLVAEGEAQATERKAAAQAKAIELVRQQINEQGGDAAVKLEVAKEAVAAFEKLAKEGNTLVLQGENATVSGVIANAMSVMGAASSVTNANQS